MVDETPKRTAEVTYHYLKSAQFRVVHVDGATAGITPGGLLHVAIFNERPAIPQQTVHPIEPDGKVGAPTSTITRGGIVREVEVEALMSLDTAKAIHGLLARQIALLEEALAAKGQP